jgi:MYXO-CTERM domain-containing protein
VVCPAPDQCHSAGVCAPATGVCSNPNKANNTACNDGDACTQIDTCQNGACTGANPVVCGAATQCTNGGVCNPATGVCSGAPKPDGTACSDGNACTQSDSCVGGACVGANPVVCAAPDQCHDQGACNPATGMCSNPNKANGTACNDGNGCTQTDTCVAGACTGANPVVCAALDQCHSAGACAPATGMCSNPLKADGAACNDGNACTQTDTCLAGTCTGNTPVTCAALDACHVAGMCDAATGACSNPPAADGGACDDGNPCTTGDSCTAGVCAGAALACAPLDACHDAGVCDPATGACSNPPKEAGSACDDGNACTTGDSCQAGSCVPGEATVCLASDGCHDAGTCNPATGACSNPPKALDCSAKGPCENDGVCDPGTGACQKSSKPDGTPCTGGVCVAGGCVLDPSGSGGGAGTGGGASGTTGTTGAGTGGGASGTTGSSGTGASSGTSGTTGSGGASGGTSGGCGCAVAGEPAAASWPLLLGALALLRRRRARATV